MIVESFVSPTAGVAPVTSEYKYQKPVHYI